MATMDIFEGDAFSIIELTRALENIPFKPAILSGSDLFGSRGVRSRTVMIESRDGTLSLIPFSERGSAYEQQVPERRDMRAFVCRQFKKQDVLWAAEIQGIREFRSETAVQQVQTEVAVKMRRLRNDAEATFGGGRSAFAQVTSAAAKDATSLTVEALAAAIPDDATATYTVTVTNVPAGTLVGRTYAERAAGTDFGPADTSDDEIYLTAWDVTDLTVNNDVELVRHETLVYEDLIPNWSSLGATMQAAVRAAYQTTRSSGNQRAHVGKSRRFDLSRLICLRRDNTSGFWKDGKCARAGKSAFAAFQSAQSEPE